MDIVGFFYNVVAGIAASAIIVIAAWIFKSHVRNTLLALMGRLTGSGIQAVYKNDSAASRDIVKSSSGSDTVRIFSMRAFRLLKDDAPLSFLLADSPPTAHVRVLLADAGGPVVRERAKEFTNIDKSYTEARYIEDIRWSALQVAANQRNNSLEMRVHREPAFVRLLITDDHLFLSFFLRSVHGDNSPVYRFRRDAPMYEAFKRYFDWVWGHESVPYVPDEDLAQRSTRPLPDD